MDFHDKREIRDLTHTDANAQVFVDFIMGLCIAAVNLHYRLGALVKSVWSMPESAL